MEFINVDLDTQLALCLAFRRDAHIISFGNDDNFNTAETTLWFKKLATENSQGFLHILLDGNTIGQLEFKSAILADDGIKRGYIYLLYLLPEFRGKGYGEKLLAYIFSIFKADQCQAANLRYLPHNKAAAGFYKKHGWQKQGVVTDRGQLMVKAIIWTLFK